MPKVSVLMPIYNTKEKYLRDAISSILSQTFKDFEFLILNDSPQNTALDDVIYSFNDKRIVYLKNDKNIGISLSRNRLIDISKGEYLAIMDHDDISEPDRFIKQVDFLDNNKEYGVVGSWYEKFPKTKIKKKPKSNNAIEFSLIKSCPILHPSSMIRFSILKDNDIRYNPKLSPAEDFDLWFQLVGKTKMHNIQESLFKYRDYGSNTSKIQEKRMADARTLILEKYRFVHPKLFSRFHRFIFHILRIKI